MIKPDAEVKLASLLIALSTGEQEIEGYRHKLANSKDFDPFALFTLVDTRNRGFLALRDIQRFLK
jgi:hypothetical protein